MKAEQNKISQAAGLTAAVFMLVLSLLNSAGLYQGATAQMQSWHMFYTPDVAGTVTGMIEAAIITYVVFYVFFAIYNKMMQK